MSYVERNLIPGERVVYRAELHWIVFLSIRALLSLFLLPAIDRATSEFAVTNRRVIIKVGLISRRTLELKLEKVESIGVDQSFFGRIFGYGTIVVVGTGGTKEPFPGLANPLEFRKAVHQAAEAVGREPQGNESQPRSPSEGLTKTCPYCAETIKAAARLCRYCGKELEAATGS